MALVCPQCGKAIDEADLSAATDLALCRSCNCMFAPRRGLQAVPVTPTETDLRPPRGVRVDRAGERLEIRSALRHPAVWLVLPGMAVYSLIFAVGIAAEYDAILQTYGVQFFVWLGLILVLFWAGALFLLFGHVRVRIAGGAGEARTGIGPLGWRRRFGLGSAAAVERRAWFLGDWVRAFLRFVPTEYLAVVAGDGRPLAKFGLLLTYKRRRFVYDLLRRELAAYHAAGADAA